MIDLILETIVKYLSNELDSESEAKSKLVKDLSLYFKYELKYETNKREKTDEIIPFLNKLKIIRKNNLEGQRFVKNKTKGKKKGHRNIMIRILQYHLENREYDKFNELSEKYLEETRRLKSERTYYRLKANIKKLSIY